MYDAIANAEHAASLYHKLAAAALVIWAVGKLLGVSRLAIYICPGPIAPDEYHIV